MINSFFYLKRHDHRLKTEETPPHLPSVIKGFYIITRRSEVITRVFIFILKLQKDMVVPFF